MVKTKDGDVSEIMDLKYIAARLAFEKVSAEEIRSIVDALLNEGVYSHDFIEIIDVNPPTLREILQQACRLRFSRGKGENKYPVILYNQRQGGGFGPPFLFPYFNS